MGNTASDVIAAIKAQWVAEGQWDALETIDPDESIAAERAMVVASAVAAGTLEAYVDARIAAAFAEHDREHPTINEAFATYGNPTGRMPR